MYQLQRDLSSVELWRPFKRMCAGLGADPEPYRRFFDRQFPRLTMGDEAPSLLAHLPEIEACHSVAGVESYILKVRVASPDGLEHLLQEIRAAANVTTRTTVVLSTFYESRPPI